MPKILQHTDGDVVEIILADHRWFEEALHELRDVRSDRPAVLADLATVLIAHAEAEESKVYPTLRSKNAIDDEEVEHSEHEHDEGNAALLTWTRKNGTCSIRPVRTSATRSAPNSVLTSLPSASG
jgi:hypothetical protein